MPKPFERCAIWGFAKARREWRSSECAPPTWGIRAWGKWFVRHTRFFLARRAPSRLMFEERSTPTLRPGARSSRPKSGSQSCDHGSRSLHGWHSGDALHLQARLDFDDPCKDIGGVATCAIYPTPSREVEPAVEPRRNLPAERGVSDL